MIHWYDHVSVISPQYNPDLVDSFMEFWGHQNRKEFQWTRCKFYGKGAQFHKFNPWLSCSPFDTKLIQFVMQL